MGVAFSIRGNGGGSLFFLPPIGGPGGGGGFGGGRGLWEGPSPNGGKDLKVLIPIPRPQRKGKIGRGSHGRGDREAASPFRTWGRKKGGTRLSLSTGKRKSLTELHAQFPTRRGGSCTHVAGT